MEKEQMEAAEVDDLVGRTVFVCCLFAKAQPVR